MMAIGVPEEKFWASTVRQLAPYGEAHILRQIETDKQSHNLGCYIYEAIGTALNGKKYREKPHFAEEEERRKLEKLSEEEKLDRVEKIFEMLAGSQK